MKKKYRNILFKLLDYFKTAPNVYTELEKGQKGEFHENTDYLSILQFSVLASIVLVYVKMYFLNF